MLNENMHEAYQILRDYEIDKETELETQPVFQTFTGPEGIEEINELVRRGYGVAILAAQYSDRVHIAAEVRTHGPFSNLAIRFLTRFVNAGKINELEKLGFDIEIVAMRPIGSLPVYLFLAWVSLGAFKRHELIKDMKKQIKSGFMSEKGRAFFQSLSTKMAPDEIAEQIIWEAMQQADSEDIITEIIWKTKSVPDLYKPGRYFVTDDDIATAYEVYHNYSTEQQYLVVGETYHEMVWMPTENKGDVLTHIDNLELGAWMKQQLREHYLENLDEFDYAELVYEGKVEEN